MKKRAKREKRLPWLTIECPSCGGDFDEMNRRRDEEWFRVCPCGERLRVQHVEYLVADRADDV